PGRQELASIPEFVGKIMAGKNAQKTESFMIFARVEALIAGWGMEEALKRAKAYVDAGADGILIHSKEKTPNEIIEFTRKWNNYKNKPIIIVPTSYPSFSEEQMKKLGIKVVIYANQGLRAAVKGMNKILGQIRRSGINSINGKIASMAEIFELQGMTQMKNNEKKYLRTDKGDIKVIIPAAGDVSFEESFKEKDLLKDLPVTMLDINGKSILQRTVDNLNQLGIQDIAVVTGYKGEKIFNEGITKIENRDYKNTFDIDSIMMAYQEFSGKTLMIYSDMLFEKDIIEKLLRANDDIVLAIDSSYQQDKFPKKDLDLVMAKYPPIKGERVINVRNLNHVLKIGKNIPREDANYEFAGIAMFSQKGFKILKSEYEKLKKQEINKKIDLNFLLQTIIDQGRSVRGVEINGGWTEIKNFEDYRRACAFFNS
ncbi:MAG: isocitrate lyase/phosphoenolpyruvate mutase family protein, partial [Caldisericia bacterium]|nr:isocitrate lyase/phosphoenolpyruvate mutase family protein [Caldisericia bacterium]